MRKTARANDIHTGSGASVPFHLLRHSALLSLLVVPVQDIERRLPACTPCAGSCSRTGTAAPQFLFQDRAHPLTSATRTLLFQQVARARVSSNGISVIAALQP